jgi:hypothetical protein
LIICSRIYYFLGITVPRHKYHREYVIRVLDSRLCMYVKGFTQYRVAECTEDIQEAYTCKSRRQAIKLAKKVFRTCEVIKIHLMV